MSKIIQNTILALPVLLTLTAGNALAQEPTGPEVLIAGSPVITPVEAGATRSFEMRGSFPGAAAAQQLAERLMVRRNGAAPMEVVLTPSTDGSRLSFIDPVNPSAFFQVNTRTGDISCCRGMQGMELEANTPNLPDENAAARGAYRHLELLGLLPANPNELVVQHIGGLRMGSRRDDGTTSDFAKLVTVHFGRRIDGLPVSGPGSKITVHLGDNGTLVGLERRWIELAPKSHAAVEFLSPAETVASVQEHLSTEWDRAQRIDSEVPQLGFFDDGRGRIEPAYFFRATLTYDPEVHEFARSDDYTRNYLGVVSAIRTPRAQYRQQAAAPAAGPVVEAKEASRIDPIDDDEPSNR